MTIERALRLIAGAFVMATVLLAVVHSPYWLLFTAFVGLNLIQASFTGFCPAAIVFKKLGVHGGNAFS